MRQLARVLAAISLVGLNGCANLMTSDSGPAPVAHAANAAAQPGQPAKVRAPDPWGYSNLPFGE